MLQLSHTLTSSPDTTFGSHFSFSLAGHHFSPEKVLSVLTKEYRAGHVFFLTDEAAHIYYGEQELILPASVLRDLEDLLDIPNIHVYLRNKLS